MIITPIKKTKHNILVVDGSDHLLELVEKWLLDFRDVEVLTTTCFDRGLEHIKSNQQISLVIFDHCEKQERNGLWFMKEVSIHSPNTLRYLTTSCVDDHELENYKREGNLHLYSAPPLLNTDMIDKVKLWSWKIRNKHHSMKNHRGKLSLTHRLRPFTSPISRHINSLTQMFTSK